MILLKYLDQSYPISAIIEKLKSLIVNHPSILNDKTQTDQDEQMFQLFGTTDKSGMISNDPIKIIEKPIYNWVLAMRCSMKNQF
jgi:hypothetical protein